MKDRTILVALVFALITSPFLLADDIRYAKEVRNVSEPYTADWIVSPDEELHGDQNVLNASECDIRGVISCNDSSRLRVDILLNNPISYEWQVCYAVEFEYINNVTETYIFFPVVEKFFYIKWKDQELVDEKELYQGEGSDKVGVTSSDDGKAFSVYLIVDKDKHFIKDKYGDKLWFSARFYSGYLGALDYFDMPIDVKMDVTDVTIDDVNFNMQEADATKRIKLGFVR